MAGAEGLMLPLQPFEMITDDLGLSATIGHLYARHRPRVRRIARTRVNGGLRAAAAGPLNAGLVHMVGFEYEAQADPVDWLLAAVISAGPDRDSVTAVAYRWGFSRVATYYRRAYGVQPSHTLRN